MYERLIWKLPDSCRKPVKFLAGWTLKVFGLLRFLPKDAKLRIARFFTFGSRSVIQVLDNIPEDQLSRCVLFLSVKPHTRETRLAEAARLAGWNPILIHADEVKYDASAYFSFHARVGGLFQLLWTSWLFRGPLIHVFAPDGAQAYLLCIAGIRPLILDINDTCKSHLLQFLPRVWEACEREAIHAANGMTHRDLRVKYLCRLYNYPLPRYNMLAMDWLLEMTTKPNVVRPKEREIRVASVGFVGKGDHSVLRIVRCLCADSVHVHLYINPSQREADPDLQEYVKLGVESEYFHFEHPVFGESYWSQLSRYDFGISACDTLAFGETPVTCTMDSFRGAGSSRLMDYFRLGLGVIISPELYFQWFLARRYALAVVPVNPDFLKSPRLALEAALSQKITTKKKKIYPITAPGAADRLGAFYSKVVAGARSR